MFEEKFLEPHFTSVLAPYMLDVVEQKRALGNKYNAGVEALSAFDDFCNEQQLRIPAISKELLQKWEKKRPHENETTQCFRISYVRILCKYLHSNGYDAPCAVCAGQPERQPASYPQYQEILTGGALQCAADD